MNRGARVLWVAHAHPPDQGGVETFAATLVPRLVAHGHEVTVLACRGGPSREPVDGVDVIREPVREAMEHDDPAVVLAARRRVATVKTDVAADLYHVQLADVTAAAHATTRSVAAAPTVVTVHNRLGSLMAATTTSLTAGVLEGADVVVAVGAGITIDLHERLSPLAHRVVTIPNAIDAADAVDVTPPCAAGMRIVVAGRLAHQKGIDRLLTAMPAILAMHPDVHLDVVGDGPDRADLEALAARLDVVRSVTFHGRVAQPAVAEHLAAANVVVIPSRYEGLPFAALEAAAVGRPVVASRVAGIDEVVVDDETGVLVGAPSDLDADATALADRYVGGPDHRADEDATFAAELAVAVGELLADPDRAARLGAAAHARVRAQFGVDAMVEAYDTVYRAVTAPVVDVAVVVPAWNAARHLGETLDSILGDLAQHPRIGGDTTARLVVVDDGSTDDTGDVARSRRTAAAAAGIDLVVLRQPNLGSGLARNAGIAISRARFIAHFDADDLWPTGRIDALLTRFAQGDELDAVFGSAVEFADPDAPEGARWSAEPMQVRMPTVGLLRADVHDRHGGFRADRNHDQVLWASSALATGLRYATIDAVVTRRRVHGANKSHGAPFLADRTRVAVVAAHLARVRRQAPADRVAERVTDRAAERVADRAAE